MWRHEFFTKMIPWVPVLMFFQRPAAKSIWSCLFYDLVWYSTMLAYDKYSHFLWFVRKDHAMWRFHLWEQKKMLPCDFNKSISLHLKHHDPLKNPTMEPTNINQSHLLGPFLLASNIGSHLEVQDRKSREMWIFWKSCVYIYKYKHTDTTCILSNTFKHVYTVHDILYL